MDKMRTVDVLVNLESYDMWDCESYKLTKPEAETIIEALKVSINLDKFLESGGKVDG